MPHAARPDQARIGRLETPDRAADGPFHVDVLVIGPAKRKVCTRGIAIRQWHVTEDHAARIIFDDHPTNASILALLWANCGNFLAVYV